MKTRKLNEQTIIFNTGAEYADEGQIIVARQDVYGVLFYDLTRDVYGLIAECVLDPNPIIRRYVSGAYTGNVVFEVAAKLRDFGRENSYLVSKLTEDEDTICDEDDRTVA